MRRDAFREMVPRAVSAVALAVLACCALGALSPAARADGDPGSDVLVYQNLFVAADSNISIAQQVELGDLLTAASRDGFTIRVAIIATPADLGAITQLWRKPASYASFLGIELSLAYSQRLLVVMPDGFGFNWQGHSAGAAYQVLARSRSSPAGPAWPRRPRRPCARSPPPRASGSPRPPQARQPEPPAAARTGGGTTAAARPEPRRSQPRGHQRRPLRSPRLAHRRHRGGGAGRVAVGGWLARRAGLRLAAMPASRLRTTAGSIEASGTRRRPRLAVPGTWLAGGFVAIAVALIAVHTVLTPAAGAAPSGSAAADAGLASNPNLDPGTSLSTVAPGFTLTDQFGQPVSLSSYRGKVVILAFNDSECTTVCPLTTVAMVDAKAMLGAAASQVQLVGIEANPKATSIDDVLSYSQVHGMLYQWRYLTGSLSQLQTRVEGLQRRRHRQPEPDRPRARDLRDQSAGPAGQAVPHPARLLGRAAARAAARQRGVQPAAEPSGGPLAPVL